MYRQEFFIVAKKDIEDDSSNYRKFVALRSDHSGEIDKTNLWTDNIFLARHFRKEQDAVDYASKQLDKAFIAYDGNEPFGDYTRTDYLIVKVFFDVDASSKIISVLYT